MPLPSRTSSRAKHNCPTTGAAFVGDFPSRQSPPRTHQHQQVVKQINRLPGRPGDAAQRLGCGNGGSSTSGQTGQNRRKRPMTRFQGPEQRLVSGRLVPDARALPRPSSGHLTSARPAFVVVDFVEVAGRWGHFTAVSSQFQRPVAEFRPVRLARQADPSRDPGVRRPPSTA